MKIYFKNTFFIVPVTLTLGACATVVPQRTNYSFDVYEYKLDSQQFNKIQKYLNTDSNKKLTQTTLSGKQYWSFTDKFEAESFFSIYKYKFTSCHIEQSSVTDQSLKIYSKNGSECKYEYSDKNLALTITATNLKKDKIYYTIKDRTPFAKESNYAANNNIDNEYLILTYKENESDQMFIINKNWLDTPWNYYHKSPQAQNNITTPLK